jgi:hypothetical protein
MRVATLSLLLWLTCLPAHALEILVDTGEPGPDSARLSLFNQFLSTGHWQFLAQGFSLSTTAQIVGVQLHTGTTFDWQEGFIRIWLTDAIGPGATAADNLLGIFDVFAPAGNHSPVATGDVTIPAGDYYLVFSPLDFSGGLLTSNNAFESSLLSANDPRIPDLAFPPGTTFRPGSFEPLTPIAMRVLGIAVPEPSSGTLIACGLIALALIRQRRDRAKSAPGLDSLAA